MSTSIGNTVRHTTSKITLFELREHENIWYKLKVLIYDFSNIKNDSASVARLERTVDEVYISEPYFTFSEASLVKNTLAKRCLDETGEAEELESSTVSETIASAQETRMKDGPPSVGEVETIEEAIKRRMSAFYDKRNASGDFRPCGPHDMVPVYLTVFGIDKRELMDERFLGRLKRSGISGV